MDLATRTMVVVLALLAPVSAHAQGTVAVSAGVAREVGRARALVEAGAGAEARLLLDSLARAQGPGSNDLAEALYWRAMLGENATDAERDWKRLTIETPLSPRAADGLLRLGELELLRGRPAQARSFFERVGRDFPASPQQVKGTLWIARSWLDERNPVAGCSALGTLADTAVPDGEQRLQYDELRRRCADAAAVPVTAPDASPVAGSSTDTPTRNRASGTEAGGRVGGRVSGRFSVQLAAYDTRAEAERRVTALGRKGITARVDGNERPFRVRVGRYATRGEATRALAKLKRQGLTGFVADLTP